MHAAIRADPSPKQSDRKAPGEKKKWKQVPLTYDERKDKLKVSLGRLSGHSFWALLIAPCGLQARWTLAGSLKPAGCAPFKMLGHMLQDISVPEQIYGLPTACAVLPHTLISHPV